MQLEQELDPGVERDLRLARRVHVAHLATLHEALLVVDHGVNDAVANGLGDDVLGVLLRVEVELGRDVAERDATVREGDGAQGCLDDVVAQAQDERVIRVGVEGGRVRCEREVELCQVPDPDRFLGGVGCQTHRSEKLAHEKEETNPERSRGTGRGPS